ncbi:hypothetical protein BaRGS_00024169 [Batillaria attramentaria]|uniref:TIR domain-containing protein n=1 Tax=Batillaria attramentaria TaxID=370345 RepID=A0ABD0KC51_9CAEN
MGILYNCARSTDLRHKFRGDNTANVFTPMLAKENSSKLTSFRIFALTCIVVVKLMTLLTLSYIIDEDDNDLLLAEGDDFDFLLRMIGQAWKAPDHRYWESLQTELMYFRLEELLQGLTNLARNDKNKKLLVKKGALDLLRPILQEGSDMEKHEATKALWQLAFDDDNKHAMKKEPGIIELLHQCKEHKHSGIASAADGILWVLGLEKKLGKDTRRKLTPSVEQALDKIGETASASSTGHVMISYQWDHQKTLKQIRDRLRERQYNVWMDIDHISGSTLQAMAEAVEGAAVVLMCMSQRYKDSPNCRMEAEYAAKLKRTIIPLLMESGYTPNGWLGILLGSKLYFDFSGRYPFDKKFEELVRELGEKGKLSQTGSSVRQTEGRVDTQSDISSWTKEDVANWLSDHHLNRHGRLKKLSGKNLIFLQKLSKRAPEYFYMYLDKKLHQTDLEDMMNFSDAIDALP